MRYIILIFILTINLLFCNIKNLDTFVADFKQTVTNKFGNKIIYSGLIKVKKNGYALWVYKFPIKKEVYINKKNITINEPSLQQAIVSKSTDKIDFIKILQNIKKTKTAQYVAKYNKTKYYILLSDNGLPKTISYFDELENKIDIEFFDIKKNISLDNSIFNFNIPKSYDIIKK